MKCAYIIACLGPLLLFATPLCGEDGPEITFDKKECDFGKVSQGDNVVHSFTFSNTGKSDLLIERVKSSCGCTTALISDKTVPPGEKGEIKATFSTRGRRGKQRKTITVTSNDPANNHVTLSLTGEIVVPLSLDPPRLSLRDVVLGEEKTEDVRVTLSEDWKECRITDIISTNPHIQGHVTNDTLPKRKGGIFSALARVFQGKKKKAGSRETTLQVRILPDAPKGRIHGRINLKYEGEKKGEAVLPVYARIVGNISARPERLSMGSITPDEGKKMSVVVSDIRGKELAIKSIETGSDFISTEQQPVDASSIKIIVTVKPRAPTGFLRGQMKLHTGDPSERVVEIPYSGRVQPRVRSK